MRNILLASITCFILTLAVSAQDNVEYGNAADLKGLTTFYVDTAGDLKVHDKIVADIAKDLPNLKLVDSSDTAQMLLMYKGDIDRQTKHFDVGNGQAVSRTFDLPVGVGTVAVAPHGADRSRPRLVLTFHSRQDGKNERMPYTKFAREFIKVYKTGNGMK